MTIKGIALSGLLATVGLTTMAQDTTKKRSIDITSSFKPVLREASKLNFNASAPVTDTGRPKLQYNLPAENLLFPYQAGELKPLAFTPDTGTAWTNSNYIKVGIGNIHQPLVKAGFSFGDGEYTFFNIFADHVSSKGSLQYQQHSESKIGGALTYRTPKNLEWTGNIGVVNSTYYLYGGADSLPFTKSDLRQRFQTIEAKIGLRNIVPTEFGLTYEPTLRISAMGDSRTRKGSETNMVLNVPVTKTLGKATAFSLGVLADITNYRREDEDNINNNIIQINPKLEFKTPNFYLNAGITPSWDNGNFYMLPNLMADIITSDQRLTLQLGWIGYFNKGTYQRFAGINPWLAQPDSLRNDRVNEIFAGFKGSSGNHISYSAKIGFQKHRDIGLFVNNPIDEKDFQIRYEPELTIINTHAEAQYTRGEEFSARATFDWNKFTKQEKYSEAWGLLPLELSAQLRWRVWKDLYLRTELWAFDGAKYLGQNGLSYKGETGFDVNAGAEFKITKNLNLWAQFNNILNNRYERWHRYEVFGFNVLGGVTYTFNQK